jgi:hypothetical protein
VADLLERASAWLENQRVKHITRTVVYQRGVETLDVLATIGQTVFQIDDGAGAMLRVESRDYLIAATDLALGGSLALPQRGDRIRETQGTQVFVYEVMAPGDEPHWRWSDPYRKTLRIHTKQVDQETTV